MSYHFFSLSFRYDQLQSWLGPVHIVHLLSKHFFKTESVTATWRAFRNHFMLCQNDAVPDRKSIRLWVENFRTTGSLIKRNPTGKP